MAEKCVKVGCPEVVRFSLQDPCTGAPVPGTTNGVVMRCTRNTTVEKVLRDEDISEFVADCGPADRYVIEPQLQGFNINLEVAQFSPETEALLTGDPLLVSGATNIGVLYEGDQGCVSQDPKPRFTGEFFFRRRGACDPGTVANYVRLVVLGLRFNPFEIGAEGQIRFETITATSDSPVLLSGITSLGAGPYDDFEAGLVTDLGGFDADTTAYGFWVADPISDPTSGILLAADTCYTAEVPNPSLVAEPLVNNVTSPANNRATVNGLRFVTATDGPVNRMNIFMQDSSSFNFYDPSGPDAGLNAGLGNTIVTWTDTVIAVENAGMDGKTIQQVSLEELTNVYFLTFNGAGITGVVIT